MWEAQQRPVELRSGDADDGDREGRLDRRSRAGQSRTGTTSGRASASPTRRCRRPSFAAAGASATCTSTASASANLLRINGPQVVRASSTRRPTAAGFRADRAGLSGRPRPTRRQFNPLTALVSYIPSDYHSSPVQSWYVSVQREFGAACWSTSRTSATRRTICCCSPTTTRRRRTTPPAPSRSQRGGRFPTFGDITYVFNGGKSRYDAFQTKYEWRIGADVTLLSSLTLSKAKDNGAGVAREPERQLPGAAGHQQPRRRLRPVGVSPAVQQHDQLRLVAAVRPRQALGQRMSPALDALIGGWQIAGINTITPGEMVTFTYAPAAAFQVSGITQRLLAARTTTGRTSPATRTRRRPADDHQLVQHGLRRRADRSEPAVRQRRRNTVRGPNFWSSTSRRSSTWPCRTPRGSSSGSRRSTCSTG